MSKLIKVNKQIKWNEKCFILTTVETRDASATTCINTSEWLWSVILLASTHYIMKSFIVSVCQKILEHNAANNQLPLVTHLSLCPLMIVTALYCQTLQRSFKVIFGARHTASRLCWIVLLPTLQEESYTKSIRIRLKGLKVSRWGIFLTKWDLR